MILSISIFQGGIAERRSPGGAALFPWLSLRLL